MGGTIKSPLRAAAMLTVGLLIGWLAGWLMGWRSAGGSSVPVPVAEVTSLHSGPTIQQVQALASLVTLKVDVADVQETRLSGYTGGEKAALLIKGDFLLSTDLSQARFALVNPVLHSAVLVLPQPQVTSPRLDQSRTRIFAITESGLWAITPGGKAASTALVNRAYAEAQAVVAHACQDPALLAKARQQAEAVLGSFFEATGWRVTIRWTD